MPVPSRIPPRLIRVPEGRKPPPEIQFFPDSAEQCCASVDRTGLRPQLDRAFLAAIQRARLGGR